MKPKARTKEEGNGSWEAALAEYQETFVRELGGVGFLTFDWADEKRFEDAPTDCKSIQNARTSFRTLMTFASRKRIAYGAILTPGKPAKASLRFDPKDAEEDDAGRGLIAELIFRLVTTDEKYFEELIRLKKAFDAKGSVEKLPMKCALFVVARDLAERLQRDPTKEEVLNEFYQRTKHRPLDPYNLFREAKLGFLKVKRGRPSNKSLDGAS